MSKMEIIKGMEWITGKDSIAIGDRYSIGGRIYHHIYRNTKKVPELIHEDEVFKLYLNRVIKK